MARAEELIELLSLRAHPEGGFYSETYRSSQLVSAEMGERAALTAIYFLLRAGDVSRWHRVRSDEVWAHVEGAPLNLHVIEDGALRTITLGELSDGNVPYAIVPANCWQAAEPSGAHVLVNCFVAPGFSFDDFSMAGEEDRRDLEKLAPRLTHLF